MTNDTRKNKLYYSDPSDKEKIDWLFSFQGGWRQCGYDQEVPRHLYCSPMCYYRRAWKLVRMELKNKVHPLKCLIHNLFMYWGEYKWANIRHFSMLVLRSPFYRWKEYL